MIIINQARTSVAYVVERRVPQAAATPRSPTMLLQTPTSALPSPTSSMASTQSNDGTSWPLLLILPISAAVLLLILWIHFRNQSLLLRQCPQWRPPEHGGDVHSINLDNIPSTYHQRTVEKKLMTTDEVNERFPPLKYKNWIAARTSEGMPKNGDVAVTVPPSRAANLREPDAVLPSSVADVYHPVNSGSDCASLAEANNREGVGAAATEWNSTVTTTAGRGAAPPIIVEYYSSKDIKTTDSTVDKNETPRGANGNEDGDEDKHIHTAVSPESFAHPGDSCAICISTLEEDDDIRGLTCGHAFHVGCLDPWLTTRRARCPLCKTDYYVPKPCPEGEAVEAGNSSRFISSGYPDDSINDVSIAPQSEMRERPAAATNSAAPDTASGLHSDDATPRRWKPRASNPLSTLRILAISILSRAKKPDAASHEPMTPSPSQLEASMVH